MIFCPSCGAENSDGMRFCAKCGTVLAPSPESQGTGGERPPQTDEGTPFGGGYQQPDPYAVPAQSWHPGASSSRTGLFAVGERREPAMVVLFAFLTCGIYGLIWWYSVITEIKNALGREDINPGMEILLVFVTCGIYGFYLYYKYPQLMLEMQDRVGRPRNDISMTTLLLAIFGLAIISIPIMQSELNKIWDSAGGR